MSIYRNILYNMKYFTIWPVLIRHFPPTERSRRSAEISYDMCEGGREDGGFGRLDWVEDIIGAYNSRRQHG